MADEGHAKEIPADLARAGEARHFISWRAAVAGIGGGALTELATAAEAALTDVFLSSEGTMRIEAEVSGQEFRVRIEHAGIPPEARRMHDLPRLLESFLDGYEISPTSTVLVKALPRS